MKLSRVLLLAGAAVAVGLLLTQTEKGNELRRNIADRSGDLARRLKKLRDQSGEYAEDFMDDAEQVARKARKHANGQMA